MYMNDETLCMISKYQNNKLSKIQIYEITNHDTHINYQY